MPEKQKPQTKPSGNAERAAQVSPVQKADFSSFDGRDEWPDRISAFLDSLFKNISNKLDSAIPESKIKRGFKKSCAVIGAFLDSLDENEPEPPPPVEKPLRETIQEFVERCRDRERRNTMLKEFGEWSWTVFFRGTVFFFLFVLTIWGTIWALDFSDNHRIKFYPPDEVVDYLTAEHESLEAAVNRMTLLIGRKDNIPFDCFDAKLIEIVKPVRIYSDEYGIYLMTSKGWYNGEHGIFIAKDEENMPPDINWGLIEGRIYTYAIYD